MRALENKDASTFQYFHVEVTTEKPKVVETVTVSRETKEEVTTEESFLRKTFHVNITNVGNVEVEKYYYITVGTFDSFFLKAEPKYDEIQDNSNGKTMVWFYALNPGESLSIAYSISYVPLIVASVLVLAAIIILLSFYKSSFYLEKEIIMHKKDRSTKKKNAIKIKLNVINKSGRKKTNVILKDTIPSPLTITGDFGTAEPTSIKKHNDKTELIWRFDVLEPHEERIVTYEMRSKLKLLGKVLLPRATLEHKSKKRTVKIHSKMSKFEL
jgi:hypothetical protein